MAATDTRRPQAQVQAFAGGEIDGWTSGMDNRASDSDVPRTSLRDAVNVDILNSGKPRMRRGMRRVIADAGAHSGTSFGNWIVWATPTTLNISGPNFTKTTLLTDARLALPISYTVVNGDLYFTNERINGIVTSGGTYATWGIAPPTIGPTLSATPGIRQIGATCTFVLSTGEESGAPLGSKAVCGDNATVQITNIPQSLDSRVVATRLYLSELDGTEFYSEVDLPTGVTSYTFRGYAAKGEILRTQFMAPLPPGQLIDSENGIIYVASGNNVFHTEPLRYGVCAIDELYYAFPQRVTLLRAVTSGLYVGAEQTYFLSKSGTDDVSQVPQLPYRAIEGATCDAIDSKDIFWMSERGLVRGTQEGQMENISENQLAIDAAPRACMGIVQSNGHKAVVAVLKGTLGTNPLASADYLAVR